MEPTTRLDIMESSIQTLSTNIEVIKVGQKYIEQQQAVLMSEFKGLASSLQDPQQSALGRALSKQIDGCASRFDGLLDEQSKELEDLKKLVNILVAQNERVQGALSLIKFVGFSALISGICAMLMIFLQLMRIITIPVAIK